MPIGRPRITAALATILLAIGSGGASAQAPSAAGMRRAKPMDALRAGGGDARLTVLAGRGHFILDTCGGGEPYAWLLHRSPASRRAAAPP